MMDNANKSSYSKWRAFLEISRANLLIASLGHATLGLLLAAGSISDLFSIQVPLYIGLHYSIALFGCNINSYYDYEVDKRYKTYIAESVDILGTSLIKKLIIVEFIIAAGLISIFYLLGYELVVLLASIGLIGALFYSADPVRIKKHGLISPIPVFILYSFPLLGGWFIFQEELSLSFIIFVFGYLLMNEGFTLVNTCEDYSEDKAEGITTWSHVIGLKNTLILAFCFSLAGVFCIGAMGLMVLDHSSQNFLPIFIMLFITLLLILVASWEVYQVLLGSDLEQQAKRYGKKLQRWFIMTRYPLIISTLLMLL